MEKKGAPTMTQPFVQLSRGDEPLLYVAPHTSVSTVQAGPVPQTGGPTLSDVFNAIWRRKRLLIVSNLALCAIAFVIIKNLPPLYTAVAKVMIDPRRQLAADADPALAALRLDLNTIETLESEIQVINSTDVLRKAMDQAGIDQVPATGPGPGVLCALLSWLPEAVASTVCAIGTEPDEGGGWLDGFRDNLEIVQVGLSRVVGIAYKDPAPARAAEVANAVAEVYIEHQSKARETATQNAVAWLSDRIPGVRAELEQAREALERYRGQEALVDGRDADLLRQQIAGLGLRMGELRADYQTLQSRIASAKALVEEKGLAGVFEVVGTSPVAEEQRITLSALRQRLQELGREFGSRHPEIVALSEQIAAAQRELDSTAAGELSALVNEAEIASQQLGAAENQLTQLRSDLSSILGAEIQLRSLEQEVDARQASLDVLLERARQSSDLDYNRPVAWIVSLADPPLEPDAPNKLLLFAATISAGIGLSLGIVLLLELRERRYALSLDMLKRLPNAQAVTILPANPNFSQGRTTSSSARRRSAASLYGEAMRRVHGSLMLSSIGQSKVVLVSSAEPGEGKTTFTAMLGCIAARRGQKVLVVDCDFLRPALHSMFRMRNEKGFDAYFRSPQLIKPLQVHSEERLHVLATGGVSEDIRDNFFRLDIPQFLSYLTKRYELVVIDTPPVLALADAKVLAPFADTVLLIVKWKLTPMSAVQAAIDELHSSRRDPVWLVLNQVDLEKYGTYNYNSYPVKSVTLGYSTYRTTAD